MEHESLLQKDAVGKDLLEKTLGVLKDCAFKLDRTRISVFVCGGRPKTKAGQSPSWRAAFLEWIRNQGDASRLEVLLAEKAYDAAIQSDRGFLNISEFEETLADLSDCVLLFPESAGSYAEAGVFASNVKISYKVLVANDASHHNASSFLSRGPLHAFGSKSRFCQPIVLLEEKINNPAFETIRQRIEENALRNRKTISWTSAVDVDLREKLAIVVALIRTAVVLSEVDLLYLLEELDLSITHQECQQMLRILLMFKQVERRANGIFRYLTGNPFQAIIEGAGGKLTGLSASYREYYMERFPKLLEREESSEAE